MKKLVTIVSMLLCLVMGFTMLTACGSQNKTITVSGSSSISPLMQKLAANFEKSNGKYRVIVNTSDSGTGISDTKDGKNDIGMVSRELKSTEIGYDEFIICKDGLAIVVNNLNTLTNVSLSELKGLYENDTPIGTASKAISREDGSGTRGAFADITTIGKTSALPSSVEIQSSTGAVMTAVSSDTAKLGYISLGSLNNTVKALTFNNVEANVTNILNGTYTLQRPFVLITKTGATLSEGAIAFIKYLKTDSAKAIIIAEKYVNVV